MDKADLTFWSAAAFLTGTFAAGAGWSAYLTGLAALIIGVGLFFFTPSLFLPVGKDGKEQLTDAKHKPVSRGRKYVGWGVTEKIHWRHIFLLLPLLTGFLYFHLFFNFQRNRQNLPVGGATFTGVVIGEPKQTAKAQLLLVRLQLPWRGDIKIVTALRPRFHYGDELTGRGRLELNTDKTAPPTVVFPTLALSGEHRGWWLKENLLFLKNTLVSGLKRNLSAETAALGAGILFGYQADFSPSLKTAMARSGTTHLVALSGYNIAILVMAVGATLGLLFRPRITFFLTALTIFLFVLMVGAEASVVRAAIMGFLALLARQVGRPYRLRNSITLTAAAMAIAKPSVTFADIGFQLSFISLLGIAYLQPALAHWWQTLRPSVRKERGALDLRENIFTTLAAQAAVVPLLLHYFGQFSLTSFLANIFLTVSVPLAMLFGFLLSLADLISPILGSIAAWPALFFLSYELSVIKIFSVLYLPVSVPFLGWFLAALYYAALILFIRTRYPVPARDNNSRTQSQ